VKKAGHRLAGESQNARIIRDMGGVGYELTYDDMQEKVGCQGNWLEAGWGMRMVEGKKGKEMEEPVNGCTPSLCNEMVLAYTYRNPFLATHSIIGKSQINDSLNRR
jgi:hypothetical protein